VYPALLLVPSAPDSDLHGLARLRVFLDSVLLMGAMALLFWYFLLLPLVLHSQHTFLAQIANGAYVLVDLGLLFILIYMLLYAKRPEVERIVLGLWIAAAILVFIANLWYVFLHQLTPMRLTRLRRCSGSSATCWCPWQGWWHFASSTTWLPCGGQDRFQSRSFGKIYSTVSASSSRLCWHYW
jgi:hypothetical protein